MKKHLSLIFSLIIAIFMAFSSPVFATEHTLNSNAVLKGAINGYGSIWHNYNDATSGNFYINVTGSYWPTGQITLKIENFGNNDAVAIQVYKPNGVLAYGTLDNSGDYITMANTNNWHNIKFANGMTGKYRIHYSIINWNGDRPSSGRINCWIY